MTASLIFQRSWTSLREFGPLLTARIGVLCGEWVGIKMEACGRQSMIGLSPLWASRVREYCCWVIIVKGSFRVMWTGV